MSAICTFELDLNWMLDASFAAKVDLSISGLGAASKHMFYVFLFWSPFWGQEIVVKK